MNDEAFDALLRRSTSQPPLPDAGFTDRVIAALPPARRPAPRRSWRGGLIAIAVAAGALVTALRHPVSDLQTTLGSSFSDAIDALGAGVGNVAHALDFGLVESSAAVALIAAAAAVTYVWMSNRGDEGVEGVEASDG